MALLLTAFFGDPAEWRRLFAARMPELDVRIWPDIGDERDIDVAAIAVLPHGKLKSFPNLRMAMR
jgi:glyoxylate/hydroxypyruvate reductase